MKTLPDNWTTQQKAFFAGVLSAYVPRRHLVVVVDALPTQPTTELYFDHFIAVLEPRISSEHWDRVLITCMRLFA
jgi:predicted tellurium resistance membrane protein TerC